MTPRRITNGLPPTDKLALRMPPRDKNRHMVCIDGITLARLRRLKKDSGLHLGWLVALGTEILAEQLAQAKKKS